MDVLLVHLLSWHPSLRIDRGYKASVVRPLGSLDVGEHRSQECDCLLLQILLADALLGRRSRRRRLPELVLGDIGFLSGNNLAWTFDSHQAD